MWTSEQHAAFAGRRVAVSRLLSLLSAILAIVIAILQASAEPARAETTPVLVPLSQGADDWTANGGTELSAVDDGACSAADPDWITGGSGFTSSFNFGTLDVPFGATVTAIQFGICYGDDNTADDFQTITPYVSSAGGKVDGTPLNPHGNMAHTTASQTIPVGGYVSTTGISFQIGVTDHGFLASSRVRVYAIWARAIYDLPPPSNMTIAAQDVGTEGSSSPYASGQEFLWLVDLDVTGGPTWYPYEFTATWDSSLFNLVTVSVSAPFTQCRGSVGALSCTIPAGSRGSSLDLPLRMLVKQGSACSAALSLAVKHGAQTVASGSDLVSLNGGCASPTATTAAPTSTAAATLTPTATTSQPSPTTTATGTPAAPTASPTGTPGTPSPTATATSPGSSTPTPTPTAPPRSQLPYVVRALLLARDGSP